MVYGSLCADLWYGSLRARAEFEAGDRKTVIPDGETQCSVRAPLEIDVPYGSSASVLRIDDFSAAVSLLRGVPYVNQTPLIFRWTGASKNLYFLTMI